MKHHTRGWLGATPLYIYNYQAGEATQEIFETKLKT